MQVPDELRPVCSCGSKMVYIKFVNYYDEVHFWECGNEACINSYERLEKNEYEPDELDERT